MRRTIITERRNDGLLMEKNGKLDSRAKCPTYNILCLIILKAREEIGPTWATRPPTIKLVGRFSKMKRPT